MRAVTFGSLFSGIGGFDLGFERAGMKCLWQVEYDKKCQDVLRKHFDAEVHNDVREVGKHNLAAVDVICGGFPCQDLSIAGRRAGLDGERSGLWYEFHRIIAELKPRWVVIENVPGLLSSNRGEDFAVILRGLVECGYGASWRVLDAQYFGVAQRRRRVFIVGSLGDGRSAEVLFEREGGTRNTPPSREAGKGVAHAISASPTATGRLDPNGQDFVVAHETGKGYWTEGLPGLRSEPGGMPENIIAFTIQQNDQGNHKRKDRPNGGMYVKEAEQSLTVGGTDQTVVIDGRNMADQGDISSTLQSKKSGGYSLNYQPVIATQWDTQRARIHDANGVAPTLPSGSDNSGNIIPSIASSVGVRRLTPVECERLQGFPDNWTDGQADSTRYRQLGNAVAVPCAKWIAERIVQI